MSFDQNTLFTILQVKMKKICKVGRYATTKETEFPYMSFSVSDISGGNYDLENSEGSQDVAITLEVYSTGSLADTTCEQISQQAKKIMLSYGFQCRGGPMKVTNAADTNITRWVGRYQRIFGSGDVLKEVH